MTVQRQCFFVDHLSFFCLLFAMPLCFSVYLCLVVTCWERALSHWYLGSGVVLDCINSWSLHPYLLRTDVIGKLELDQTKRWSHLVWNWRHNMHGIISHKYTSLETFLENVQVPELSKCLDFCPFSYFDWLQWNDIYCINQKLSGF